MSELLWHYGEREPELKSSQEFPVFLGIYSYRGRVQVNSSAYDEKELTHQPSSPALGWSIAFQRPF